MTKLDDDRRMYLRGSYLDRIVEVAQFYSATHTYFIDSDFAEFIRGEFDYLRELTDDERQYLRDQVGLESLRRVALSRAQDREEFFRKLIADNPEVIVHYADLAFDLGWLDLVEDAVARMRTYPAAWKVRLDGATERFGCLVLHVSFVVAERGAPGEVKRMREEIRLRSLATCEVCGESGRLRLGPWAKTVCDKHSAIFEEFQEDDGKWADPWRWLEKKQSPEEHISDEIADVQAGLDELDRGESVHIDEVLGKARAIAAAAEHRNDGDQYPPESAEVLKGLEPVRQRPRHHIVDLAPQTAISRQIEADIEKNYGRKADLLIEFYGNIEIAVVAAMSVASDDVDFWLLTEVGRWESVQPLSDDDRDWLLRYLRSLVIDELGRRQRRVDGSESLKSFLAEHPDLASEAEALVGRERELLDAYAGDLADSARGRVVKEEYLDGYIREEIALWPDVGELSDDDRDWLRRWLRRMIDSEYERIKKRAADREND